MPILKEDKQILIRTVDGNTDIYF